MAILVRELGTSRSVSESVDGPGNVTLRYLVKGTTELSDAVAEVLKKSPTSVEGLLRDSYSGDALDTGSTWEFEVSYTSRKVAPGEYSISFDTTGGTVHVSTAYSTTRYPSTAPDFGGAIGVNDDGGVEGVDIIVPVLNLSCRATIVDTYVTAAYIQALSDLTGKVSSTPFLGWAAGEVLFTGAQGEYNLNRNLQLTFNFAVSRNVTGLTLGSIAGIAKTGHDYLWMRFQKQTDLTSTPKSPVTRPQSAHVAVVYERADLNQLRIGVQ